MHKTRMAALKEVLHGGALRVYRHRGRGGCGWWHVTGRL